MKKDLDYNLHRILEIIKYSETQKLITEQLPPPSKDGGVLHRTNKNLKGGDKDLMDLEFQQVHNKEQLRSAISDLSMALGVLSGLGVAAGITATMGWSFLAGSTAFSLAEIKLAINNGETYEAGFLFVFMILNLDDIGRILGGRGIAERLLSGVFEYIKNGGKLIKNSKFAKEIKIFISNLPKLLKVANQKWFKNVIKNFDKFFASKPLIWTVGFFGKIFRKAGTLGESLLQITFPIVGGYITFDQLYKLFYGSDNEKMAIRKLSHIRMFIEKYISDEKTTDEVNKRVQDIVRLKLNELGEQKLIEAYEKAVAEAGSVENFNESLKNSDSSYFLRGNFSDTSKKIGDDFYNSISGIGTDEVGLYDAIKKIKNESIFDEVNIYLYKTYGENIYDLLNEPYELEFDEKEEVLRLFMVNRLKPKRICMKRGKFMNRTMCASKNY